MKKNELLLIYGLPSALVDCGTIYFIHIDDCINAGTEALIEGNKKQAWVQAHLFISPLADMAGSLCQALGKL